MSLTSKTMSHEALVLTELPDGRELFRLNFKVRPTERHPLFLASKPPNEK